MSSKHEKSSGWSRRSNYYPTGWSAWEWNEEHQCNTRYREVTEGNWQWDYAQATETEKETPYTPRDRSSLPVLDEPDPELAANLPEHYRHDEGLADITQGLEGATIGSYAEGQQYPAGEYDQEYFESSRADPGNSKGTKTKCPECSMVFPRSTELERHHKTVHLNNGVRPYECLVPGCPANVRSWTNIRGFRLHEKSWHGPHSCSVPGCSRRHPFGFSSEADLEVHQVEHSDDLQRDQSRDEPYGRKGKGSSYNRADASYDNQIYPAMDTSMMRKIKTRNPRRSFDEIDKRFKVHRSSDFRFGRVFKVLWSEPVGSGGTEITYDSRHEGEAFHKVRRFVITSAVNRGHSICLPILTYGFQGVLKPGVHPEDHAVVYSSRREGPYLLEREEGLMSKRPIRIEMASATEKLDPLSRLNFAKLYTVEHNVKVFFIGSVARKYERALIIAYNEAHPPLVPGPQIHPDSSEDLTSYAEQVDPSWTLVEEEEEEDPAAYNDGYEE